MTLLITVHYCTDAVFFNLDGGAELQECITVAPGTPVHICTGELKYTVVRSISITSGGTPGLCWWNPRVPRNPG